MRFMMFSVMCIALSSSAYGVDVNVSGDLLAPACTVELPADNTITLPEVSLAQLYKGEVNKTATTIKIVCHELTSVRVVLSPEQTTDDGVVATRLAGIGLEISYGFNLAGGLPVLYKPGETVNHSILNNGIFVIKSRPVITDKARAESGSYSASALLSVEYR